MYNVCILVTVNSYIYTHVFLTFWLCLKTITTLRKIVNFALQGDNCRRRFLHIKILYVKYSNTLFKRWKKITKKKKKNNMGWLAHLIISIHIKSNADLTEKTPRWKKRKKCRHFFAVSLWRNYPYVTNVPFHLTQLK